MISIGIGNSWELEDAVAEAGCEVHAFDPTHELHRAHRQHAYTRPRMRFHFLGLATGANASIGGGYGGLAGNECMRPLDEIFDLALAGRLRRAIDVLKIDCEGCEWGAFADIAARKPELLARVQFLLIELHMTPRYNLPNAAPLNTLMGHVMDKHGMRLFRKPKKNRGFPWARNEKTKALVEAGLDREACCAELHLMRTDQSPARRSYVEWLERIEPAFKGVPMASIRLSMKASARINTHDVVMHVNASQPNLDERGPSSDPSLEGSASRHTRPDSCTWWQPLWGSNCGR